MSRYLVTLFDLDADEIKRILAISSELKQQLEAGERPALLQGRGMALLFEKPSLRTRVSFEMGIGQLGGNSLFLGDDVGWGSRETIEDFSRVLSQYVDVIVSRSKGHHKVVELANHADCSVINGLTDYCHPCQALADILTLQEHQGSLEGQQLAYVGDANNVAAAWQLFVENWMLIFCWRHRKRISSNRNFWTNWGVNFRISSFSRQPIRGLQSRRQLSFIPMSGPAWGRKPRWRHVRKRLGLFRLMHS